MEQEKERVNWTTWKTPYLLITSLTLAQCAISGGSLLKRALHWQTPGRKDYPQQQQWDKTRNKLLCLLGYSAGSHSPSQPRPLQEPNSLQDQIWLSQQSQPRKVVAETPCSMCNSLCISSFKNKSMSQYTELTTNWSLFNNTPQK